MTKQEIIQRLLIKEAFGKLCGKIAKDKPIKVEVANLRALLPESKVVPEHDPPVELYGIIDELSYSIHFEEDDRGYWLDELEKYYS